MDDFAKRSPGENFIDLVEIGRKQPFVGNRSVYLLKLNLVLEAVILVPASQLISRKRFSPFCLFVCLSSPFMSFDQCLGKLNHAANQLLIRAKWPGL